jgi:hypothetical protein
MPVCLLVLNISHNNVTLSPLEQKRTDGYVIVSSINDLPRRSSYVAPFNSIFHNKTLCENGVMWIIHFLTYLSTAFHIYLLIIINI